MCVLQAYLYPLFEIKRLYVVSFSHKTRVANWEPTARSGPLWLPSPHPPPTHPPPSDLLLLRPLVQLWRSSAAAVVEEDARLQPLLCRRKAMMMSSWQYSKTTAGRVEKSGLREQYSDTEVTKRESTSHLTHTRFEIPPETVTSKSFTVTHTH